MSTEFRQTLPPPELVDIFYTVASFVVTGLCLSLCARYVYQWLIGAVHIRWTWWYPQCLDWMTPLALLFFTAGWGVLSWLSVMRFLGGVHWQVTPTHLHRHFLGHTHTWPWEEITGIRVRSHWKWLAHTLPLLHYRLEAIIADRPVRLMDFEHEVDALAALEFLQTSLNERAGYEQRLIKP